jgi:uncharacterized protein YhaN
LDSFELAIRQLRKQCNEAVSADALNAQLQLQLREYESEVEELRADYASHVAVIAGLQERFGLATEADLDEADTVWVAHSQMGARITELDMRIISSASMGINAVLDLWAERDEVELRSHADALTLQLEELSQEASTLAEERDGYSKQLGALEDSDEQSEALSSIADCRGRLETLLQQYRLLVIQERMLVSMLDERARNDMGPVVERTSKYLATATCGQWVQMVFDLDDHDRPEVKLRRGDVHPGEDELVPLKGLSEGTLDQLYIALRLAILVEGVGRSESMPLVVDDILLSFDDARASATLRLLAQVSHHFQVVFLTHHSHLIELATLVLPAEQFQTHEMPNALALSV